MSNAGGGSYGIGFCGALTILFIGLKLGGVIDWGWLVVFSPVLIELVVIALAVFAMVLFYRH